jgi:hypothetical protein
LLIAEAINRRRASSHSPPLILTRSARWHAVPSRRHTVGTAFGLRAGLAVEAISALIAEAEELAKGTHFASLAKSSLAVLAIRVFRALGHQLAITTGQPPRTCSAALRLRLVFILFIRQEALPAFDQLRGSQALFAPEILLAILTVLDLFSVFALLAGHQRYEIKIILLPLLYPSPRPPLSS